MPAPGSRLSHINHCFWNTPALRNEIKEILIKNISLKKSFILKTAGGETLPIKFTVKVLGREEKIYIL